MKLEGIGFANFRSIGKEPVWLNLTKKVNVLIGANNSGKSNVFRALQFIRKERKGHRRLHELDQHQRDGQRKFVLHLRATINEEDSILEKYFKELTLGIEYSDKDQVIQNPFWGMEFTYFADVFRAYTTSHFTGRPNDAELRKHMDTVACDIAERLLTQLLSVYIIPDIRKIDAGSQYEFDGRGIIATLASWQVPKLGDEAHEVKFQKLNALLQKLLRSPNVSLEVPPEKDVIIVRRNGLRLPLASYGTGIHELIILAIAIYSHDDALFCIEEPEIHLHPLLQKEFLRFLIEETSNQYVLATHSHALMVLNKYSNVVHLWQEDGVTKSRTVEGTDHSLDVLHDLGVSASDLLQARSVIWVEGPSDRIYLTHWLSLLTPDLRGGIDYSVMFYGGRLLSHLSLGRDEFPNPDDLIPLLRINQHSAIVIDSDQGRSSDTLNATKSRVLEECTSSNIPCWITDGREIENYLPLEAVTRAYAETTGEEVALSFGRYARLEHCLKKAYGKSWRAKWSYDSAKVEMAHRIVPHIEVEHISDNLRAHLQEIIDMIREA